MNEKNKKIKRIGIDARFYGPVGKGLGRYTQEVVDNLLEIDHENEYVIFLGKENFDSFQTQNLKAKKVLADVRWYTLAEQILMPYYIWREKIDLMHFHHFNVPVLCPTKFVVTIHDLILIKFPSLRASKLSPLLYKIKNIAYKVVLKIAVKRSQKIIAVSEFTKDDILDNFSVKSSKVVVTYEGVSSNLLVNDDDAKNNYSKIPSKYGILKPYLLYVGNAYPHKNLEWLIDSFFKHKERLDEYNLVLVGKEDYFYKRLKEKVLDYGDEKFSKKIIFPGYVPDGDLIAFYQEATAYVFPSKYEGFGIPPLEAMANNCLVISSNAASMPEILGEAAIYFEPESEDGFIKAIENLKNEATVIDLKQKGLEQIKKYSWLDCAEKTRIVLNESL